MVTSIPAREQTDAEWKHFWSRFRRHEPKLGDAVFSAWVGDIFDVGRPPEASELHLRRLAATYVDLSDDGEVTTPGDTIQADETKLLLMTIGAEIEYCERSVGRLDPDELAARFERMRESPVLAAVAEIEELHPIAGVALAMQIRHGVTLEQAKHAAIEIARVLRTVDRPDSQ